MHTSICPPVRQPHLRVDEFPGGPAVKNLPTSVRDERSKSEWGRSPRKRNGNLRQDSCLGDRMDRGPW